MNRVAIIMEDMRLGGPQKQLINLLNQLIKNKNVKKYHLILPLGSKKIISKFLDPSLIKIEEIDIQYLTGLYRLSFCMHLVPPDCFRIFGKVGTRVE